MSSCENCDCLDERAAIVKWLREATVEWPHWRPLEDLSLVAVALATAIERGDHHKPEGG